MHQSVWPTDLSYDPKVKSLSVIFDTGETFVLPAEYLRVESPSAEVQAHGGEKVIVGGRRHVGIMEIEAVGNYAVRIVFDDLHDTGIYSWRILYDLGVEQEDRWADYLAALNTKGLSRDP
ncbi:MAG: DUF971 domain-containing protein [Rhodospirillaceae bacterium]|nr:DUF971 domain-containing protein [Rhodospirillaceae bacterium]